MVDLPHSVGAYVRDNRLIVPLEGVYRKYGTGLEGDVDAEGIGNYESQAQGLAREIYDVMKETVTIIDAAVDWGSLSVESLLREPRIAAVEGEPAGKIKVLADIMTDVAEEVANVVWKHYHGESVDDMSDAAPNEAGQDQLDAEWTEIWQKTMREFGIIE